MYKCPECGNEVEAMPDTKLTAQEVMDEKAKFPIKIVCNVNHVYRCAKCAILIIKSEAAEYYNNVD